MPILLFDFLNAYPYQAALAEAGLPSKLLPHPRAVVETWRRGEGEAALLPLPALVPHLSGVLPWGIGSSGPVQSVLLLSEHKPSSWQAIWTDSRSTASVALLRWLMAVGKLPTLPLVPSPPKHKPHARLLIGDVALRQRQDFPIVVDVGEAASQAAGRPVVVGSPGTELEFAL